MKKIIIGITGASGSGYAKKTIAYIAGKCELHIVITDNGRDVFKYECGLDFDSFIKSVAAQIEDGKSIKLYDNKDMFGAIASGSHETDGMIIIPSSMATIAKLSAGISDSLLTRAADVCIKERRKLIVCPRETPYSTIHLRNMTSLSEQGVVIFPLSPPFYGKPQSLDELQDSVVGRVLYFFDFKNDMYTKWN